MYESWAENTINFAKLGIRASQWTNYRWNTKYCENASGISAFIPITSTRPTKISFR